MIGTPEFKVKAEYNAETEELAVQVVGTCAYGSRAATRTADVTDEKVLAAITSAVKKAVAGVSEQLGKEVTTDAAEALVVATKKGEEI